MPLGNHRTMDLLAYQSLVASLPVGKRLPDAVYIHTSVLSDLPEDYSALVQSAASTAGIGTDSFNVVKFDTSTPKVSLLRYGAFLEDGFPALQHSWSVDLSTLTTTARSHEQDQNPPILHRKETLLAEGHPLQREFHALTNAAEAAGLFETPLDIGRKDAWDARLRRVGLTVSGNRLVEADERIADQQEDVQRHRTALVRYSLSTPMQQLWRHAYLDGHHSVFDYGCGRGDDVRALQRQGLQASGWDPHFAPTNPTSAADVVNLGFVLNVIENLAERRDALLGAWALTRRVLSVAVILGGRSIYERFRLYRDGVITNRGTFQKFYTQSELREYVSAVLEREPIAVGPGVLFVFKTDEEEQRFLAQRQSSWGPSSSLPRVPAGERPRIQTKKPPKWEAHRELIEAFWGECVTLGRLPEPDEFDRTAEIRHHLGSPKTLFKRCKLEFGDMAITEAREHRQADRLVYLALNIFEGRHSMGSLPAPVRRDVKAFWKSFSVANTEARNLLYSAGKPEIILAACKASAAKGLGYLEKTTALYVHGSIVLQLPAVLRVYLGCASRVYGELESADLVKIHIGSNKVSLMQYDDFEGRAIPLLQERVKITLGRADFRLFEYVGEYEPQPLYLKSQYIPDGFPHRDAQLAFDAKLRELGLFDLSGYGPDARTFREGLANAGLAIRGFRLIKHSDNERGAEDRREN